MAAFFATGILCIHAYKPLSGLHLDIHHSWQAYLQQAGVYMEHHSRGMRPICTSDCVRPSSTSTILVAPHIMMSALAVVVLLLVNYMILVMKLHNLLCNPLTGRV